MCGFNHLAAARAFITGANFFTVPGHYDLPLGEGFYTFDSRGIIMNTRGGQEHYQHPNVRLMNPSILYDSGWYAWYAHTTSLDTLHS